MTGRENIYMNGASLGMTKAQIDSKLDQIIEDMKKENNELLDSFVKKIEKIR